MIGWLAGWLVCWLVDGVVILCAICLLKNILTLSFLMIRRIKMGAESVLGRKFESSGETG